MTSKRAEPSSCCSCAAKPADGNIGPSMATSTGGLWDSMAQGCWAPRLRSTQGWEAGSSTQQVMAWPSPSPGCGWTHQLSPSCYACRPHMGNSSLRTHTRLCWPVLIPGKPFCPSQLVERHSKEHGLRKAVPFLPVGYSAKKKGDISTACPTYTDGHVGKGWPWSPCASLEMWPLQSEGQTHF